MQEPCKVCGTPEQATALKKTFIVRETDEGNVVRDEVAKKLEFIEDTKPGLKPGRTVPDTKSGLNPMIIGASALLIFAMLYKMVF